jgi:hypothetical protein
MESGGTDQPQVLEGVIVDDGGPLYYTAQEQQRLVNLTHAMVFLKRDAHLAEICAKQAYHYMRQHLRECFRALSHEDVVVADIYSDVEYKPTTEYTTRILDL